MTGLSRFVTTPNVAMAWIAALVVLPTIGLVFDGPETAVGFAAIVVIFGITAVGTRMVATR